MDKTVLALSQLHRAQVATDGDTPADRVGIKVEGANKWLTLIQNASKTNGDQKGK